MSNLNGVISFRGYRVVHMEYDCPANFNEIDMQNVQFRIGHNFGIQPDGSAQINLAVRAFYGKEDSDYDTSDLRISVEIAGNFKMANDEEWNETWNSNAIAILVPYARAFISCISAQTGRPTIILPTINTYNLIKANEIKL